MLKPILSCKYKTTFLLTTQLSEQTDRSFNATTNLLVRSCFGSLCLIIIMFVCVGVVGVVVVEISAVCSVLW